MGENAICRLQLYSSLCLMHFRFQIVNSVVISLLLICYFVHFLFTSIFIQIHHSNVVQLEKIKMEFAYFVFIAEQQPKTVFNAILL